MTQVGADFINFYMLKDKLETKARIGKSFYEVWEQKSDYAKKGYIIKMINWYKSKGSKMSVEQVWFRIFNLYYGAVNIFKPTIAMGIYCKFKPRHILDFTMGWGGRLVGACALDIPEYTGIDLNTSLKPAYDKMVAVLRAHSTTKINLRYTDALKVDYNAITYDLVLTSPPYYNIEEYKGSKRHTKEEWNENFYEPIFKKTYDGLSRGGHYCINIPDAVYKDVAVKVLGKASMFIPMPKSQRAAGEKYKEYIYVWKKN